MASSTDPVVTKNPSSAVILFINNNKFVCTSVSTAEKYLWRTDCGLLLEDLEEFLGSKESSKEEKGQPRKQLRDGWRGFLHRVAAALARWRECCDVRRGKFK
jgi:hypothetical protein